MSPRPRRALVGLVAAAAALAALPTTALAAGETLSVTPDNAQAGGLTGLTETVTFAGGDTPKTMVTSLAPGLLGNLNANPACLVGSQQLTASCQIGTETTQTTLGASPGNLYLVPPAQGSTDVAGIEIVTTASPGPPNQYVGISPNPNAPGGLNLTTTFPNLPPGQVTGFTAKFTTLNGQAFARLPSSCAPATSSFTVTYYGGTPTGSASGSFMPTGCAGLPYAPALTAMIIRDKNNNGGAVTIGIMQAGNESASKQIVFSLPNGLAPNLSAVAPCLNTTGCTIGTATATSPLVPSVALSNGTVRLTATSSGTPTISITFPTLGITLPGAVNLNSRTVTFANVPDVPLTSLTLKITGTSGGKAFNTDCKPANLVGTFTPQSGTSAKTVTSAIKFTGCASATGSTSGLASGHPKLKFKASDGAKVASVAIGLPGGLSFSRSAFVSHKVCTTKPKQKCTTTTLITGLGVTGANAKAVSLKGGRVVITLNKAAGTVSITLSDPLVAETSGFQGKVKKHKVKTVKFTLKITDAGKTATTLSLKLKAH